MKLATTTGDFGGVTKSYLESVACVQQAGFKHLDLSLYSVKPNDPLILADDWQLEADRLLEYAENNGLSFVQCHSPDTNPLDEAQFERAVEWNIRAIQVCGKLGIPNMVVHSGWDPDATKQEWYTRNRRFFEKLFDAAEKNNVNVLHENTASSNMPWFYPKTGQQMREFSQYMNHPLFHSCWDTGHANIEGPQYDEIVTLGDDLYAVHINDNRGSMDEHLIPFMGTVNMDEIMCALKAIDFKGPFTFEAGSAMKSNGYWLYKRRVYMPEQRLCNPTLEMQMGVDKLMYSVGKHILSAYGVYED